MYGARASLRSTVSHERTQVILHAPPSSASAVWTGLASFCARTQTTDAVLTPLVTNISPQHEGALAHWPTAGCVTSAARSAPSPRLPEAIECGVPLAIRKCHGPTSTNRWVSASPSRRLTRVHDELATSRKQRAHNVLVLRQLWRIQICHRTLRDGARGAGSQADGHDEVARVSEAGYFARHAQACPSFASIFASKLVVLGRKGVGGYLRS